MVVVETWYIKEFSYCKASSVSHQVQGSWKPACFILIKDSLFCLQANTALQIKSCGLHITHKNYFFPCVHAEAGNKPNF